MVSKNVPNILQMSHCTILENTLRVYWTSPKKAEMVRALMVGHVTASGSPFSSLLSAGDLLCSSVGFVTSLFDSSEPLTF